MILSTASIRKTGLVASFAALLRLHRPFTDMAPVACRDKFRRALAVVIPEFAGEVGLVREAEGLGYFFDPSPNQEQFLRPGHLLPVEPLLGCLAEFLGKESFQLAGRMAN